MAQNEITRSPMEETIRIKMLSSALKYYRALIDDSDANSEKRAELVATYQEVGQIYDELVLLRESRNFALLSQESVRQDIGLSLEQGQQLLGSGAFSSPSLLDVDLARERRQIVTEVLRPEQLQRLSQIALQLQGPSAIIESIVSGNLNLSRAQATAIQETFLDYLVRNGQTPTTTMNPNELVSASFRPDAWLSADMKKELMKLVLQRLTSSQREAWSKIVGPEFSPE